jgi:uncharacterized membrane protein
MSSTVFFACFWLAVLVFCMVGGLWIFRVPQRVREFPRRWVSPRDMLDARYAYGELSTDEYLQRVRELPA